MCLLMSFIVIRQYVFEMSVLSYSVGCLISMQINWAFVSITVVYVNNRVHYDLNVVIACLHFSLPHYHNNADFIECFHSHVESIITCTEHCGMTSCIQWIDNLISHFIMIVVLEMQPILISKRAPSSKIKAHDSVDNYVITFLTLDL